MNYYVTQEQYEQLREMYNAIESLESLEKYGKLIDQIGNQNIPYKAL